MSWDFETDPDFQAELDWIDAFVRDEVEPLDFVLGFPLQMDNPVRNALVKPLQKIVRDRGLWACHLSPELGGRGYGQLKLALMNEILGRSRFGPVVFGCQAPDSGNSEILAQFGTPEQKACYLTPLLENEIVSCFALTEPHGGADPTLMKSSALLKDGKWVINGEKWFISHAHVASFYIVIAATEQDRTDHHKFSAFIVPADTPGIEIVRNMQAGFHAEPAHAHVRFLDVTVPEDAMLGARGQGFVVAQVRLGGGRVHHAMRTLGQIRKSFDMICERALSRFTSGSLLSEKQMIQEKIADSWIEMEQFRLLVLRTAWRIDKYQNYVKVRKDISAIKAIMPKVLNDIASRALYIHGSLGITPEMPFAEQVLESFVLGLADGPTEVHKVTLSRQILRDYRGTENPFTTKFGPDLRAAANEKYAAWIAGART